MADGGVRAAPAAAGASRDLISALHDELLLTILLRVPTIDSIRTCALSRRWRTLWTRLPELTFNDKDAGIQRLRFADLVDGALHRSAPCDLSSFEVSVYCDCNVDAAARVPAWILAAALRATGKFRIWMMAQRDGERVPRERDETRVLLDLPCLPRAKNISLANKIKNNAELRLPGPDAGAFACLTALQLNSLHLTDGGADLGDLVSSRCPQLERLQLSAVSGLTELSIIAEKLLQLDLVILDLERLSLVASKLCVLHLFACFGTGGTTLSVQAPMLEDVAWFGVCPEDMRFDGKRKLRKLVVGGCKLGLIRFGHSTRHAKFLQHFSHTDFLRLQISLPRDVIHHKRLMEEIKIPHHSVLELQIDPNGHAFGSSVASLLQRCNNITSLKCSMLRIDVNLCSAGCLCDEPASWKDEKVCFNSLEELVFNDFRGTCCEMDFLIFMIGRSKALKTVSVAFCEGADLIEDIEEIRKEMVSSLPAGCSVQFS